MSAPTRQPRPAGAAAALLPLAQARYPQYLADLAELVAVDSGSYSPGGVNRVGDWVAVRLRTLGFTVERIVLPLAHGRPVGDVVLARRTGALPAEAGGRRILLVAHLDTVFEDGTAAQRPFHLDGAIGHGPGVSDDKGGLLAGLCALEVLARAAADQYAELVFLATPDEEIGSPASRPVTESVAQDVDCALVLECARENGDLVIARKGIADYLITLHGRAAHSGIEPERGANAALAAAHLLVDLQALNGRWEGVTVNVGVIRGGTRANIVCPEAELRAEVRATTLAGLQLADAAVQALAARRTVEGTRAHVELLDLCPPMEDSPASRRMLAHAQAAGAELGLGFAAAATGGAGDGNLVSGSGVPTLDGLGPVGGADHTPQEWLDTATVPARVALLAALITRLGSAGS
ncbi:glutamate carboxypeptidase [Kitasatospora sp. MAA4]|uniref:M20/M25/M40 family metallo-hydrolase n=1 Tax=Kitasatospora sp. MAA4 TaxID=3035093 RepID=UPI0024755606|nr:M20/M25/M40 family metallo-hydrolase [Kitasatospora sp. MAA4]MDH6137770.1 glutamate carboxypeptidase [Kitasatospora sp. MAA4]